MKPEDYLNSSENVEMGICFCREGSDIPERAFVTAKIKKRPNEDSLLALCNREKSCGIEFIDEITWSPSARCRVCSIELFYSGRLVGKREIPDLHLSPQDNLQVAWSLTISELATSSIG